MPGTSSESKSLDSDQERALWRRLDQGDFEARRVLIDHYLPFARILAAKLFAKRQVDAAEFGDYLHYAVIGLMEAVDRYDVQAGASFKTFAAYRIQGSVLNGIESISDKQEQLALRSRLRKERLDSLRSTPGRGVKTDLFSDMVELAVGLALGYMLEDFGMVLLEEPAYEEHFYRSHELAQAKRILHTLMEALPEPGRSVIRYHYLQRMGVVEIGSVLGVSKGRVSQIHHKALRDLRKAYLRSTDVRG